LYMMKIVKKYKININKLHKNGKKQIFKPLKKRAFILHFSPDSLF